jgi:hypothetical protein
MSLRYEDVAQNGWPKVYCMPHGMGQVAYGKGWNRGPLAGSLRARGVIPILSRLRVESLAGPVAVFNQLDVDAWFRLGHATDTSGLVQRVLLNLGADLHAPRARTYDPQPAGAGERIKVGRVFAEHVFTRPFAAPAERRVTSLDLDGEPVDLGEVLPFEDAPSLLKRPQRARALAEEFELDPAPVVFGLAHTDSNQHVNSLAYIPLFEDAALRRLAAHGISTASLQLREVELAYRKPCFAGEQARIGIRCFDGLVSEELSVQAYLAPEGLPLERANCMGRLRFVRV